MKILSIETSNKICSVAILEDKNLIKKIELNNRLTQSEIEDTTVETLLAITRNMGFKEDYDRASERLIFEIRKGKLGRYTLDKTPVDASPEN